MATGTAYPPPLESGDHLTREEFHRRYLARPDIKRAELIEGVVYVSSPASADHGLSHGSVVGWLYVYKTRTLGVALADTTTILMGDDSEVQPDACLYRESPQGNVRVIESAVFPGLRLAVAKLLAGDDAGVIAELLNPQR